MGTDNVSFVGYGISAGDMPGFDILFRSMSDFEEKRESDLAEGIISKDGNYTIS